MKEIERTELLDLTRISIEYYLDHKKQYTSNNHHNPIYLEERAVFVTLHKNGNLRGCIGHMHARIPLYKAVIEMAVAAAFEDPRFPSVQKEELDNIEIEISVLSPMERI